MTKFEEIALLKEQMRNLLSTAKAEKRSLTEDEQKKFDELQARKNQLAIDEALHSLETEVTETRSAGPKLQFAKAVSDIVHQRSLAGYNAQSIDPRGMNLEKRAADPVVNTGTASSMIGTTIGDVIKPLEKGLIIDKMGIKMQSGVVGNLQFPTIAAIEASIEGENTRVVPQDLDINNIKATPWRVAVSIRVSNDAIDETNDELFGLVIEQLSKATARTLNKVMFSGVKVGRASAGVFVKDAPNVIYTDNPTFADVVALETSATSAGVDVSDGTAAYSCHPKMYGILKSTPVEKGSPKMIIENGMMNGYPVHMTAYMDDDAIGFGVYAYCAIGQWGKIRLTVDTTSHADTNETKFTLNSKYDIVQAYKEAFAVAKKGA